jgi:hypothetical protein
LDKKGRIDMVIFGPVSAIPQDEDDIIVFNLTSASEMIPRLPGLIVRSSVRLDESDAEKAFDMWYYDYVLNDMTACSSLMAILEAIYNNSIVYICITEYSSSPFMSIINECFMKILQTRYGIKYSIINTKEDYDYIDRSGCDFMTVSGIQNFDEDRRRFRQIVTESRLR